MKALIQKELRLTRRALLIWLGFILILGGFAYFEYLSMEDSLAELSEMMNAFPKILMVTFGIGERLDSVLGWYGCIYYWVTILTYSYAVYLGISCIGKEKAQGTAEYLFTKPVSRSQIVMAKTVSSVLNLFILSLFSGLIDYFSFVLPLGGLEQKGAVITTTIGMFFTEVILFSLALLVSSFAKTYKKAVRSGAALILGFYGIYIAAGCLEIPALYYLTPLKYFDVYMVAKTGIGIPSLLLGIIIVGLSIIVTNKNWQGKEI